MDLGLMEVRGHLAGRRRFSIRSPGPLNFHIHSHVSISTLESGGWAAAAAAELAGTQKLRISRPPHLPFQFTQRQGPQKQADTREVNTETLKMMTIRQTTLISVALDSSKFFETTFRLTKLRLLIFDHRTSWRGGGGGGGGGRG